MCAFCYDEQPLKISDQIQKVISEIKCCNYEIFSFVKKTALKLQISNFI